MKKQMTMLCMIQLWKFYLVNFVVLLSTVPFLVFFKGWKYILIIVLDLIGIVIVTAIYWIKNYEDNKMFIDMSTQYKPSSVKTQYTKKPKRKKRR